MAQAPIEIVLSNGQKAGKTLKELQQNANRLKREINDLEPGSDAFVEKTADFQKVTGRLGEVRKEVKGVNDESKSLVSQFTQFLPFSDTLGDVSDAFGMVNGNIGGATKGMKALKVAIASTGIGLLVVALGALYTFLTKTRQGADEVRVAKAKLGAVVDTLVGKIAELGRWIYEAYQGFKQAQSGASTFLKILGVLNPAMLTIMATIKALKVVFKDTFEEIERNIELAAEIERLQIEFERAQKNIEVSMIRNRQLAEQANAIADDATRSFQEREAASARARKLSVLAQKQEIQIAEENLKLINKQINQKNKYGLATDDLINQQIEANGRLKEAERELASIELDNEKQRRELKQDRLERDLDILIDGFDNVKTINEKIIADDQKTIDQRRQALETLTKQGQDSFNEQIKTIEQFTDAQIDANDLLATEDAKALNEKIRSLGLSEIIEGRLLEIIRERRLAVSDLAELEKAIADEQKQEQLRETLRQQEENRKQHENKIEDLELQFEEEQIMIEEQRAERLLSEEEYQDALYQLTLDRLSAELEAIKAFYGEESREAKKAANEIAMFKAKKANEDADTNEENNQKKINSDRQALQATFSFTQDTLGNIGNLYDKESQEYKSIAFFQTQLAAIQAAVNAYKVGAGIGGPVLGAIFAGTSYAFTGGQLAKMDSTEKAEKGLLIKNRRKIARLALGGMLRGSLHRDGGIPGYIKSSGQPIEMEDGEIILNRRVGMDPAGLAAASELNARYGGIRFFQTGGPINPMASPDLPSTRQATQSANAATELSESLTNEFRAFREEVSTWQRNLKVNNNVQDTQDGINVINRLQDESNF